jgi:Transposase DDE domain
MPYLIVLTVMLVVLLLLVRAVGMPAFANGQRYVSQHGPKRERFSDPDASWGHRSAVSTRKGGEFYGYKLQMAVCTATGLPLAWRVETARRNESLYVAPLLDAIRARGLRADTCAMDKAYDNNRVYAECPRADDRLLKQRPSSRRRPLTSRRIPDKSSWLEGHDGVIADSTIMRSSREAAANTRQSGCCVASSAPLPSRPSIAPRVFAFRGMPSATPIASIVLRVFGPSSTCRTALVATRSIIARVSGPISS